MSESHDLIMTHSREVFQVPNIQIILQAKQVSDFIQALEPGGGDEPLVAVSKELAMTMVALTDAVTDFVDPDSKTVLAHSVHSALESLREAVASFTKLHLGAGSNSNCQELFRQSIRPLIKASLAVQTQSSCPSRFCSYHFLVRDLMSSIETTTAEETGVAYVGDFLEDTKQATRSIQRLVGSSGIDGIAVLNHSKDAITHINTILNQADALSLHEDVEEKIRKAVLSCVGAAKILLKSPSDEVYRQTFQTSITTLLACLKSLVVWASRLPQFADHFAGPISMDSIVAPAQDDDESESEESSPVPPTPELTRTPSSTSSPSKRSSEKRKENKDPPPEERRALSILHTLKGSVPGFKAQWETLGTAEQEKLISTISGKVLAAEKEKGDRSLKKVELPNKRNSGTVLLKAQAKRQGRQSRAMNELTKLTVLSDVDKAKDKDDKQQKRLTFRRSEKTIPQLSSLIKLPIKLQHVTFLLEDIGLEVMATAPLLLQKDETVQDALRKLVRTSGQGLIVAVRRAINLVAQSVLEKVQPPLDDFINKTAEELSNFPDRGAPDDAMVGLLRENSRRAVQLLELGIATGADALRSSLAQLCVVLRCSVWEKGQVPDEAVLEVTACAQSLMRTIGTILELSETVCYFNLEPSDLTPRRPGLSIWSDNAKPQVRDGQFKAGSLLAYIRYLTSLSFANFSDDKRLPVWLSFLLTFPLWLEPAQLLGHLTDRYSPPAEEEKEEAQAGQVLALSLIVVWLKKYPEDWTQPMLDQVRTLADTEPKSASSSLKKALKALQTEHTLVVAQAGEGRARLAQFAMASLNIPEKLLGLQDLFMTAPVLDFAQQLTLIDSGIYRRIRRNELIGQGWNGPKHKVNSPGILELISRANRLSYWISTVVLWQTTKERRVGVWERIVELGTSLLTLNNFHSLMAVVAGLNIASVSRLEKTADAVSDSAKDNLAKFQAILSMSASYKAYRSKLAEVKGPSVPYIGVFLSDLTFLEDGNPSYLEGGSINLEKMELMRKSLDSIASLQGPEYPFPATEPLHTYLVELPAFSEKDCYMLSQAREPKVERSKSRSKSSSDLRPGSRRERK